MPTTTQCPTTHPFDERLNELAVKVRIPRSVEFIWLELLTDEERQRVSASRRIGPDIIDIWSKIKGISEDKALIELARKCNFLRPDEDERLTAYAEPGSFAGDGNDNPLKPVLDEHGRLHFGERVIRELQMRPGHPSKTERLIRAFQESGWRSQIPSPFSEEVDTQYVHRAVLQANKNLAAIRFCVSGGGRTVGWLRR
jgi:hypothetical protein